MNLPLTLRFKILALTPQIYVEDAAGNTLFYVKQKMFKLREKIEVYQDSSRQNLICTIGADRIIDWSARYLFTSADGSSLGSVGRKGMRSIWRASYDVFNPGDSNSDFEIREENPWAKIGDSLLGEIPILGIFAGYMFHPRYMVKRRSTGEPVLRLSKQSAFLEGRFIIERFGDSTEQETLTIILSLLMMVLLEKNRG